ncbi:MAG: agmatinase [Chloroflexi bacterium]|nr:agmatinase [Chloroflexota bacterium]
MPANPLYGTPRTFAALPPAQSDYEMARVVVLPVPYDATTTFRGGARDGPRAIVDASTQMELYDLEYGRAIADVGIHTLPDLEPHLGDPAKMVARVRRAVANVLRDGKFPLMLGGEHTLTAGAVAACCDVYPNLSLLYFDAHADVRGPYLGARYNHANALRLSLEAMAKRAPPHGGAPAAALVGLRSLAEEEAGYIRASGLCVFDADRVAAARLDGRAALEAFRQEVLGALGEPGRPLYVSVDLDAFDPSLVPAVGTPEPGGLGWYDVLELLRAAAARHPIVMADVVELAPSEGPVASAFTAAKLAYKLIGYAVLGPPDRQSARETEEGGR